MIEKNDWRLRGQEEYLQNKTFQYKQFMNFTNKCSHAHCEFCWHKFMENPEGIADCSRQGYCSMDGSYWICEECFKDFQDELNLKVVLSE